MTAVTLLVYDGMWRSGGIQSIIIRLLEKEQSKLLWVVCDSKKDSVGVPKDRILDVNAAIGAALPQLMNEDPAKLNIIAFGPSGASIACLVEQNIRRRYPAVESKTVTVVLHPQEFMMQEEKRHVPYLTGC